MPVTSQRLPQQVREALRLFAEGRSAIVFHALRTRMRSQTLALGLRRDLTVPFATPQAKIALDVRPLQPGDDLAMLDIVGNGQSPELVPGLLAQQRLLHANIPTCWVAIAPDGRVCYMQWLIASKNNHRIRAQWGDLFPPLAADEALLEGAYTGAAYRGQGIMPHAMARIAEAARAFGARWVSTFVGDYNLASLKGCKKAGFVPYLKRVESWLLLRRTTEFTPLPTGTPYPFD
ncbi:MAG: GNAT family N-acetyltransferase [Gemmatimonadales bacterium]